MGSESRPQPVSPRQAGCPASQPRAPDSSLGPCGPLQTDEVWEQQVRGRVCPCWASPGPRAFWGSQRGLPREEWKGSRAPVWEVGTDKGNPSPAQEVGAVYLPKNAPPRDRPPLCGLRVCTPPARTGQGLLCHRSLACVTPSHTPCMLWAGVPALTGKTRPWWGLRASLGGQAPQESDKKHERRRAGSTGVSGTREGGPRGPAAPVGTRSGGRQRRGGPSAGAVPGPLAGQGRGAEGQGSDQGPEMPWSQARAGSWPRGGAVSGATVTATQAWRSDSRDLSSRFWMPECELCPQCPRANPGHPFPQLHPELQGPPASSLQGPGLQPHRASPTPRPNGVQEEAPHTRTLLPQVRQRPKAGVGSSRHRSQLPSFSAAGRTRHCKRRWPQSPT